MALVRAPDGTGSGFFVDGPGPAQLLVTNLHVLQDREGNILDGMTTEYAGASYPLTLVLAHHAADIAIMSLPEEAGRFPTLDLDGTVYYGEWVMTYGFPFGQPPAAAEGIVRRVYGMNIESSNVIWPGQSGGVLLDLDGEVVGVTHGRWNGMIGGTYTFSTPAEIVIQMLESLR